MNLLTGFYFLRPHLFWLLLFLLPLAAFLLHLAYEQRQKARQSWGEEELIERFSPALSRKTQNIRTGAWLTAIFLLVFSAAGPILEESPVKVQEGSMELICVVDVSNSMAAEDYRDAMPDLAEADGSKTPPSLVLGPYGSRLDITKHIIETQIIPSLERNKIGIVNYTGQGFIQADLTDDYQALIWVMDHWMRIGQAPGNGSDYGEGLQTALSMFKEEPPSQKQKVVLLFTDGGFTGEKPALNKIIEEIRAIGVKIIVVGIGSRTPVTIPLYSREGQVTGYLTKDGEVVTSAIDETALQGLVSVTQGEYVRLDPAQPNVKIQWARALGGTKIEKQPQPVFQYPLALAMLLLLGALAGRFFERTRLSRRLSQSSFLSFLSQLFSSQFLAGRPK